MDAKKNGKMFKKIKAEGKPLEEQTLKELYFRLNLIKMTIGFLEDKFSNVTPDDFENEELSSMSQEELEKTVQNAIKREKDNLERIRAEIAKKTKKEKIEVGLKPARLSVKPQ